MRLREAVSYLTYGLEWRFDDGHRAPWLQRRLARQTWKGQKR
jgi:hypothetical protein